MDITQSDINEKFKMITVGGRIDWENARVLDRQIQQVVQMGCINVVFDFDKVTFICSGGIGALVYNFNKVKKLGGAIYIICDNDYVNYIFATLKFDVVFDKLLFKTYADFTAQFLQKEPTA